MNIIRFIKREILLEGIDFIKDVDTKSFNKGDDIIILKKKFLRKNDIIHGIVMDSKDIEDCSPFGEGNDDIKLTVKLDNNKIIKFFLLDINNASKKYYVLNGD